MTYSRNEIINALDKMKGGKHSDLVCLKVEVLRKGRNSYGVAMKIFQYLMGKVHGVKRQDLQDFCFGPIYKVRVTGMGVLITEK